MSNRQHNQSGLVPQETFAPHPPGNAPDAAPMRLSSAASHDAVNENVFKIIAACNMQVSGVELATFWMRLA